MMPVRMLLRPGPHLATRRQPSILCAAGAADPLPVELPVPKLSVVVILVSAFLNLLGFTSLLGFTPLLAQHFGLEMGAKFGSLTRQDSCAPPWELTGLRVA